MHCAISGGEKGDTMKAKIQKVADFLAGRAVSTEGAPLALVDQLRAKRKAILREAHARAREIDRQIDMLVLTDAETVMSAARAVLDS
jgi:hypothetical protein